MSNLIKHFSYNVLQIHKTLFRRIRCERPLMGYIGCVGRGNLGDDAMFEAIKKIMPEHNIEIFSGARRERLLARLGASGRNKFNHIVLGGGTLLNQGYLGTVKTALSMGATLHTFGTGVGSSGFSETDDLKRLNGWSSLLKQFKSIGVRGPHSRKHLEEIGVEKVEVIGDLALALTLDSPQLTPDSKGYILNVALPNDEDPDFPSVKLIEEFGKMVIELKSIGYWPIPVAFCKEDIYATKRVLALAELEGISIYFPINYSEYFEILNNAEFVIGVRLHSAVLSCCAGVPPILIGYREKCADFMQSMELMDWHCDAFTMKSGDLTSLVKKIISLDNRTLRKSIHRRSEAWREHLMLYSRGIQ